MTSTSTVADVDTVFGLHRQHTHERYALISVASGHYHFAFCPFAAWLLGCQVTVIVTAGAGGWGGGVGGGVGPGLGVGGVPALRTSEVNGWYTCACEYRWRIGPLRPLTLC